MKYGDLPVNPKPEIALWCPACMTNYSATRGDYWMMLDMKIGTCDQCEEAPRLILARTVRKLVRIKPAEAEKEPTP